LRRVEDDNRCQVNKRSDLPAQHFVFKIKAHLRCAARRQRRFDRDKFSPFSRSKNITIHLFATSPVHSLEVRKCDKRDTTTDYCPSRGVGHSPSILIGLLLRTRVGRTLREEVRHLRPRRSSDLNGRSSIIRSLL
jgi:hypothetical protein